MQQRGTEGRKDSGRVVVGNVEEEKRAWKRHFEKVSKGRGAVDEKVWDSIPNNPEKADWLKHEPTDMEMTKAIAAMKTRRAGGADKVVAELLKYGGIT